MDIVITVFMAFACIISAFAMLIVVRDILKEWAMQRKELREDAKAKAAAAVTAPVVEEEPTPVQEEEIVPVVVEEPTPVVEETPAEEIAVAEEVPEEEKGIVFSKATQTLEEKYLELPAKLRGYYDEIVKYATVMEGSKRFKNARYEEYKVGNTRLVRMLIKRGVITCELIVPNNSFKSYVSENKLSVKIAPTVIKVLDEATVQAVKDSIDIVMQTAAEERELKKQLAKERRKKSRQEKN
jgi:hypothetical protein